MTVAIICLDSDSLILTLGWAPVFFDQICVLLYKYWVWLFSITWIENWLDTKLMLMWSTSLSIWNVLVVICKHTILCSVLSWWWCSILWWISVGLIQKWCYSFSALLILRKWSLSLASSFLTGICLNLIKTFLRTSF